VRDLVIPPHLLPVVREHLLRHTAPGANGLLFPSKDDPQDHLPQSSLTWVYYPARNAAGRPDLRFHDLRHTGLTWFAQAGGTLAELMKFAGHSTPQAALRYQHAAQGRDQIFAQRFSDMYEQAMSAKG
jgi:integrase